MPAAQLCRVCCTRLKPSVTWTRRTSLALRQTPTTFRTVASVALETNPQSSHALQHGEHASPPNRVNRENVTLRPSDAVPAKVQKTPRLKLDDGIVSQAFDVKTTNGPKKPRKSLGWAKFREKRKQHLVRLRESKELKDRNKVKLEEPKVPKESTVPRKSKRKPITQPIQNGKALQRSDPTKDAKSPSELLAESKEKERSKERYMQWGHLRHQHSPEERTAARQKFNQWERKLEVMESARKPDAWPWRDDGKFLFDLENAHSMRRAWEMLDAENRKEKWPTAMLSTLHFCPEKAIKVLGATLDPVPPGYAINDVLRFIVKRLDLSIKSLAYRERILRAEEVLDIFVRVVEDLPRSHVPFKQKDWRNICRKLPADQLEELYRVLKRNNIKLHRHTLLHFASPLAANLTTKETAFEILKEIAEQGVDLNQSHYSSVITTLLHTARVAETPSKSGGAFSPQRALEYFIEKGLTPNVINFTALLESFCAQGDVAEAIRLPLLLAESGVQLDARCAATVFRGAKNSLKVENVKGAFNVARAANAPYVDVLNNALHSIFYFAEIESREKHLAGPWTTPTFATMLRIYAKQFDLEPLQWLLPDTLPLVLAHEHPDGPEKFRTGSTTQWNFKSSIVPIVDEFFSSGPENKLQPTPTTLAIMLRSYIRSSFRPHDLLGFYTFFKSRLEEPEGRDVCSQLVKTQGSIVHDTLIMTMCERRVLLRPALQIFGDMLKASLQHITDETGQEESVVLDSKPIHPAPSLFTFSILIHGLLMRGESIMAEQVLRSMREHDIEPNLVTWNILAKGYASMQNIPRTVGTFQDLEAAGFKPDAYTFKAFSKLRDQTRALKSMERIIDENKKRLEEDQVHLM